MQTWHCFAYDLQRLQPVTGLYSGLLTHVQFSFIIRAVIVMQVSVRQAMHCDGICCTSLQVQHGFKQWQFWMKFSSNPAHQGITGRHELLYQQQITDVLLLLHHRSPLEGEHYPEGSCTMQQGKQQTAGHCSTLESNPDLTHASR